MKQEDSEAECDVPVVGISHFLVVSEKFGSGKSLGIGIGKIWYWKKYRYRYRLKFWVPSHTAVKWSRDQVQLCLFLSIENSLLVEFAITKIPISLPVSWFPHLSGLQSPALMNWFSVVIRVTLSKIPFTKYIQPWEFRSGRGDFTKMQAQQARK